MTESHSNATFMVSLDFELYWGTRDRESLRDCRIRTSNMRAAVTSLLKTFRDYQVHATWATVGILFLKDRKELLQTLPSLKPNYSSSILSPYRDLDAIGASELDEPSCYAASAIREIEQTPFQEIGTHTFSHYYCLEDGQTPAAFEGDLDAAFTAARRRNFDLRSIVFPRNQVNPSYLTYCKSKGILCYRGAGSSWMYTARKASDETFARRACRIVNSYVKISRFNSVPMRRIAQQKPPFDFPGTAHLRPSLMTKEPLRSCALQRLFRGLNYAAENEHLYHLWFHPEDFSIDLEKKMAILTRVLDHYSKLRASKQMESLNMYELAKRLSREKSKSQTAAEA